MWAINYFLTNTHPGGYLACFTGYTKKQSFSKNASVGGRLHFGPSLNRSVGGYKVGKLIFIV